MKKFDVNLFSYLPRSIQRQDKDGEMKRFTEAVDIALSEMAEESLQSSWDVENADREELLTIANSLGLHPQPYMDEDILRKYIRSFGTINRLKGTDTLITYLVEKLTHFKVLEIAIDEENNRLIRTKVLRDVKLQAKTEERILDFLIPKYTKLLYSYLVAYVNYSSVVWSQPLDLGRTTYTKLTHTITKDNFADFSSPKSTTVNVKSTEQWDVDSDVTDSEIQTFNTATTNTTMTVNPTSSSSSKLTDTSEVINFGTEGDIITMEEKNVTKDTLTLSLAIETDVFPSIFFRTPFELQTL